MGSNLFQQRRPWLRNRVFFSSENVSGAEGKKNQNNALLSYLPPTISWLQPKLGSVEGGSCSLKVGNSFGVASLGRERVSLWVITTESPSLLNRQEEEDKNLQHKKADEKHWLRGVTSHKAAANDLREKQTSSKFIFVLVQKTSIV